MRRTIVAGSIGLILSIVGRGVAWAQTPAAGTVFQDCADTCPAMVVVPAGAFQMGMKDYDASQKPVHKVRIAKPFAVGRSEVSFAQWQACVAAGGCKAIGAAGEGDSAVTHVTWKQATAYVAWLSAKTGHSYRLLSEAEWEYVARIGLSADGFGTGAEIMDTVTPNRLGITGLYERPNEWVEDCYGDDYKDAPADGSAREDDPCFARALRGGLTRFQASALPRATFRQNGPDDFGDDVIGFRIARDL